MINDPLFYAIAIPAVLLMGLSKSGFMSGFGALATPLLAFVLPPPEAAALMLPLLLVMDVVGVKQLWKECDGALLRLLIPAGLIGTLIGTLLFKLLNPQLLTGIIGMLTLCFLALRLLPLKQLSQPNKVNGQVLACISGFTSFVIHAGGPPLSAYLLPQRLPPLKLTATMAIFFACINLSKWIPYLYLGLFKPSVLLSSILLFPLAPLGVWLGVWLTHRIQASLFYKVAYLGMFITGCKLLYDGFILF